MLDNKEYIDIIAQMQMHVEKIDRDYTHWYIGITNDIARRLNNEHKVPKSDSTAAFAKCTSKRNAEIVERFFLNKGMKGNPGGGSDDTIYVYCYRMTDETVE